MFKPELVFQGPVSSRSGYGDHAREIATALINSNKYDVKIIPTIWGATPLTGLNDDTDVSKSIKNSFLNAPLTKQPDIFVQISIPSEFTPIGKYANVGITAGIETTVCAPEWLEGLNKMDWTIVPSKFSSDIFEHTQYEVKNNSTQQTERTLSLTKPLHVLFEGIDADIFKKIDSSEIEKSIDSALESIDENFLFLFVGHWLQGDFGEDRKDVGRMIHTFLDTFKNREEMPGLIVKTSGATFSIKDKERILTKINAIKSMFSPEDKLPSVYLLHGDLTKTELNSLYNHPKVKTMLSFTKGEGFGRPLLEFAVSGKPVIVSGFSGHMDFLNPQFHSCIGGELTELHPSAVVDKILIAGSKWFTINYEEASKMMNEHFVNYKKFKNNSVKFLNQTNQWSFQRMQDKLIKLFDDNITVPEHKPLVIPKITLPKLRKIES
jgi:glycosyltransferase involved in cell wall biosynthesis